MRLHDLTRSRFGKQTIFRTCGGCYSRPYSLCHHQEHVHCVTTPVYGQRPMLSIPWSVNHQRFVLSAQTCVIGTSMRTALLCQSRWHKHLFVERCMICTALQECSLGTNTMTPLDTYSIFVSSLRYYLRYSSCVYKARSSLYRALHQDNSSLRGL